jgi:hypothetical protein
MEFCPRCGRYLKDDEYQCPECGNIVRQAPRVETQIPPELEELITDRKEPVNILQMIFEKWFFVAFAIAFVAAFLVTFYWRFTFLMFCIPLFIPTRRLSIGAGLLGGLTGGSVTALLVKTYFFTATV